MKVRWRFPWPLRLFCVLLVALVLLARTGGTQRRAVVFVLTSDAYESAAATLGASLRRHSAGTFARACIGARAFLARLTFVVRRR